MSDRQSSRAEATVQSDLRLLLLAAGLNLRDGDLHEVNLEASVGVRRRIDVEIGATVFEVKRDLRAGNVRSEAVEQLAGYVKDRVRVMGSRYVGVLTDGTEWHLYHLDGDVFRLVSSFTLDPRTLDVDGLIIWLDGVLATTEQLTPTPREISRRLGAGSPAHALDVADLVALYRRGRTSPSVALKRELWAKLLTTALGTSFAHEDELFVEHTLLVATAEIIGHAVVGIDPTDPTISPATLLAGHLFTNNAQIRGVVEEDFFDWVVEVDGGAAFVRTLARRLARFDWVDVEHDVMKVLYESVIAPDTRHRLGEYYTPDWLAAAMIDETVYNPLEQRVLDPACGSGTFLFHAIRAYLTSAEVAGLPLADSVVGVTRHVLGVDVHPVAVTLARVTYLLAIGRTRLRSDDRPGFSVPVYLGDSMQWGQDSTLVNTDALIVPTNDGAQLFADELRFPDRLVEDAGTFDALVGELADMASRPGRSATPPSLAAVFRRYAVHPDDQPVVADTFATMCELHDQQRNHIWAYYIRNLARPLWLSRPANRVDVLVGNPPWLSYRYMPAAMKVTFSMMSRDRGFWAGAAVATHQDLSALFLARAAELYLKPSGRIAFVMPLAALTRRQFAGFRTGRWGTEAGEVNATFDAAWDLHKVKPSFFPVPGSVILAHRSTTPTILTGATEDWAGRAGAHLTAGAALEQLTRTPTGPAAVAGKASPYAARFSQGATLVPRFTVFVQPDTASPLGAGAGRQAVRSSRNNNEKAPWKNLPSLQGTIDTQFLRPALVGDSVLPFRLRAPQQAVIPWDGTTLEKTTGERLDLYPGLEAWWREASRHWETNKTEGSGLSLLGRLDYQRGLRNQLPGSAIRVVYSASGMYLAAAVLTDSRAVVEHKLYWAAAASLDEAKYLTAILNSNTLLQVVQPLQARGEHNPRDFDKYVWQAPIPLYDATDPLHQKLVDLGQRAAEVAAAVELPTMSFQALRRRVRTALAQTDTLSGWETTVAQLLDRHRTVGAAGHSRVQ